jgi:tetratricopeptide (TPR) repeat protein
MSWRRGLATTTRHINGLICVFVAVLFGSAAFAQLPADVRVDRDGDSARLVITYDETVGDRRPTAEALIEHDSVLIARFGEPFQAEVEDLAESLGPLAARVRLDVDGTALRVALNRPIEVHVSSSYNVIAIDLVAPGVTPPAPIVSARERREREAAALAAEQLARGPDAPPPADPVAVSWRQGHNSEYTRLEFNWAEPIEFAMTQIGDQAEIRFSKPADIDDLGRLAGSPPEFLDDVSARREGDEWVLSLDLEDGVVARAWGEDTRVVIDLPDPHAANAETLLAQLAGLSAAAEAMNAEAEAEREAERVEAAAPPPAPVPPRRGEVSVTASEANGDLRAVFDWDEPVGAAVFRRGEAIWIVFDASANLSLEELGYSQRGHVRGFQAVQGTDFSAARVIAPPTTQAEARIDGDDWVIVFSERIDSPPRPVTVRRDAPFGRPGRIFLDIDGAQHVRWVDDPVVGDRMAVITATAPIQGLTSRRDFVGGSIFPSAQGGAVQSLVEDLEVSMTGTGVVIGRPDGLDLTPSSAGGSAAADSRVLVQISSPAFMDFESWGGDRYFRDEWPDRQRRAAREEGQDGRIALARFLLSHGMAHEARGMLDIAIDMEPQLATDAHILSMQGVAAYMMGRLDEAETYLSDSSLVRDPAAALWRGMIAVDQGRWIEGRRRLNAGDSTVYHYPSVWRARFLAAQARSALELNDFGGSENALRALAAEEPDRMTQLEADYVSGRLAAASGDIETAIERLEALSQSGIWSMEARALYDLYQLQLRAGQITRSQAIEGLENLRFRWRGDIIHLDTVRTLGELYVEDGAYSQGLTTMSSAYMQDPDSEVGRRINDQMLAIFRRLYLDGEADRMAPIEAVALFYQHPDLIPSGADGDRMLRRLADRLIAFDLLDPAAELLEHQVACHLEQNSSDCRYRLREPTARARVATDLAVVYLMDRRYEDALNAIRSTRMFGLPDEIVEERYLLEARALVELGRFEHALEIISGNRSPAATRLRADIAWEERSWGTAGRRLEAILGNRYLRADPLTPAEQTDIIRAAIAYSLANDDDAALRLRDRYGAGMNATAQAAAFEVLTDDNAISGDTRFADMAPRISSIDTLDAFMEPFRARFTNAGQPS